MNLTKKQAAEGKRQAQRPHAVPSDFCAIFERDMARLYSLALLLTADENAAEQCFVGALQDCRMATDVFPEWAENWSRRAIIKRAIAQLRPDPGNEFAENAAQERETADIPELLLQLQPFERFVFGISVLERYSTRECAMLLGCRVRDVELARTAALQAVGSVSREFTLPAWRAERMLPQTAVA